MCIFVVISKKSVVWWQTIEPFFLCSDNFCSSIGVGAYQIEQNRLLASIFVYVATQHSLRLSTEKERRDERQTHRERDENRKERKAHRMKFGIDIIRLNIVINTSFFPVTLVPSYRDTVNCELRCLFLYCCCSSSIFTSFL